MKKRIVSVGLVIAVALSVCCGIAFAVETRASLTLTAYSASTLAGDNTGEVKINYDVRASDIADEVGVSSIEIYKSNGSYVTTITGKTSNGLIRTDATRHKSNYVYKGTSGTSYYAVVTVFATVGSDSDSREVKTNSTKAP